MFQNHDIVMLVQQMRSGFFDFFFTTVSFLLDMPVLLLVFAILYWCVDKRYSVVFAISFFIGSILNGLVKIIVRAPRPTDPGIAVLYGDSTKDTYSFPSGHSQYASSLATGVSLKTYRSGIRRKWVLYSLSVVVALLGGFARIYLGVHFLEDVIAGLIMGVVFMLLLLWAIGKIKNELWYIAFLVPLYIIMIFQRDHSLFGFVGILTAVVVGFIIDERFFKMSLRRCGKLNVLRVLCGFPPAFGLYSIRFFVLTELHVAIDFFLMLTIGFYLTLVAPFLFSKLRFLSGEDR